MSDSPDLTGRTAIVTGAGQGLGQTYADALARQGASVVVSDLDPTSARAVADALRDAGYQAIGVGADVSNDEQIASLVDRATDAFGGLDILVNNAGLARGRWNLCSELSTVEWHEIMGVNLIGPVICARACRPHLARSTFGGVIINQSSMGAYAALNSAYSVSKLALSGLTVALAEEFASDSIRVNAIAPGMMTGRLPQELIDSVLAQQTIKRRGHADDLRGVLLFLASDMSSFMTGQTVIVDGGAARRP